MEKHITERIREELFSMQDLSYREFHSRLMPDVEKDTVIGIRVPVLRKYVKELAKDPEIGGFLEDIPHRYYEENNVHGFLIQDRKSVV